MVPTGNGKPGKIRNWINKNSWRNENVYQLFVHKLFLASLCCAYLLFIKAVLSPTGMQKRLLVSLVNIQSSTCKFTRIDVMLTEKKNLFLGIFCKSTGKWKKYWNSQGNLTVRKSGNHGFNCYCMGVACPSCLLNVNYRKVWHFRINGIIFKGLDIDVDRCSKESYTPLSRCISSWSVIKRSASHRGSSVR